MVDVVKLVLVLTHTYTFISPLSSATGEWVKRGSGAENQPVN